MRLASNALALTPRLAAAAIMLVAVSLSAPGRACDHDSKTSTSASAASSASCPQMHGAAVVTADVKQGGKAADAPGCCSMKNGATAAKSTASCPMTAACPPGMCAGSKSATASTASACPPSMCSGAKSATATTASTKGACSGHEMTSSSHKTAKVTRTASAKGKRSLKPKTAAKPANGSTAVNVTQGTAGLQVILDPQTGLVVQATAEQLAQLAAASKAQAGATIESQPRDPEIIALPGGGEMMRVPDRLMMHAIAHRDANGKLTLGCQQGNGPIAPLPAKSTVPVEQSTWEVK